MGFVEDINSLMSQCHAVLAPIDVPVGNRSRIITAMAQGVPVIAHKNTSLGNPSLVNGVTCFLCKTSQEFVNAMKLAYERDNKIDQMIKNAKRCYENEFLPDKACEALSQLFH